MAFYLPRDSPDGTRTTQIPRISTDFFLVNVDPWGKPASRFFLALAICLFGLVGCGPLPLPASPSPTPTEILLPTPTFTPTVMPSPSSSPTPLPTATATPAPTLAPETVNAIVTRGRAKLAEMNIQPLCLRWEDTDADGQGEWIGLYLHPGAPSELMAFVYDADMDAWYDLRPLPKEPGKEDFGLGQYPICELEVRDTNADGRVEIIVWGHAKTSTGLLHIFAWDGTGYALLGGFEGDAGVWLEDADGDLADEVSVRYDAGAGLVWEAVHTWDGANYGWTWERYDWFYLDRPHAYPTDTPEHVVISFYLALNDRDIPGAYRLLSNSVQAAQPYEVWAIGYATTVAAEVGVVFERERNGGLATVAAQVLAYDNVDGHIFATLWDVVWKTVETGNGWRLESATTTELDRWEAPYYR